MHSWTTDSVPEHERFALWREWRASHVFGLTADADPGSRGAFRASVNARQVGRAALVELRAAPPTARRTSQDIALVSTDSPCIHQLPPSRGLDALLHDFARSFFANAFHLDGAAFEAATDMLARLTLLAQTRSRTATEMAGEAEAVAAAKLSLLKRYIDDHLDRADLSPETTGRALRISVRQVHRLFQPSGTTFVRYLLRRRVERVASLLAAAGATSVIDAAFACGFTGSSVFYRAFKAHFGASPKDYLRSLTSAPQPAA